MNHILNNQKKEIKAFGYCLCWIMSLMTWFSFRLAMIWSGSWARWPLLVPFNWNYCIPFCSREDLPQWLDIFPKSSFKMYQVLKPIKLKTYPFWFFGFWFFCGFFFCLFVFVGEIVVSWYFLISVRWGLKCSFFFIFS